MCAFSPNRRRPTITSYDNNKCRVSLRCGGGGGARVEVAVRRRRGLPNSKRIKIKRPRACAWKYRDTLFINVAFGKSNTTTTTTTTATRARAIRSTATTAYSFRRSAAGLSRDRPPTCDETRPTGTDSAHTRAASSCRNSYRAATALTAHTACTVSARVP